MSAARRGVVLALALAGRLVAGDAAPGAAELRAGLRFLKGEGVPADPARGVRAVAKAAKLGHPKAQFLLGRFYLKGEQGLEKSPKKARGWLAKAAAQGHPKAKELVAKLDARRAKAAAAKGGAGAKLDMGQGSGGAMAAMPKDPAAAARAMIAAQPITPEDEVAARDVRGRLKMLEASMTPAMVEQLEARAEAGSVFDQAHLGYMYETGAGVGQDLERAREYYTRSRDGGYAPAKVYLRDLGAAP